MDPAIIAAIIGSVFAVLGPIITLLITRYLDNRGNLTISTGRQAIINGQWKGMLKQLDGRSGIAPITVTFVAKRKKVYGSTLIQWPADQHSAAYDAEFDFEGGFLYERYLRIDYVPKKRHRIQFGAMVFELSPTGETLSGKFVGYGAFSKDIVSGYIELERVS